MRKAAHTPGLISFAGGLPAPETFPREQMASAAREVILDGAPSPLQYDWPEGRDRLREKLAKRLNLRGLPVTADELLITNGAQDALALVLQVLQPKDVRVDRLTYPGALQALRAAGVRVRTHGITGVRYVMPAVDNPHGRAMTDGERSRALHATWLIEDDAYAELRFDGPARDPLAAAARDHVFHIGTFSKTISPGLRVGWLCPPPSQLKAVLQARNDRDLMANGLSGAILERLLDRYDYDEHLKSLRALYRERCAMLCDELSKPNGELSFRAPEGGFAVWVETALSGDDETLLACAIRCGVVFDSGCLFRPMHAGGSEAGPSLAMRLSFSSVPTEQIAEGVRRLLRALAMARQHLHHRAHAA